MYSVELQNCNNIKYGTIEIEAHKLNIKYGINGTGKSTLSKAVQYSNDVERVQLLKSYSSVEPAKVLVSPTINKILVFDEHFVNQVVFKKDEVIDNTFEVF